MKNDAEPYQGSDLFQIQGHSFRPAFSIHTGRVGGWLKFISVLQILPYLHIYNLQMKWQEYTTITIGVRLFLV